MKPEIFFQYSPWLVLLCVLAGALYAGILYYRSKQFKDPDTTMQRWLYVMTALRFLAVTFIAMLLLAPFLKMRSTEEIKPIIVFLQDNSESIKVKGDTAFIDPYSEGVKDFIASLGDDYEIEQYSFGDQLKNGLSFNFNDKATNLSKVLSDVNDLYYNKNMGAVVLATDGIFNQGNNPIYANKDISYPLYTIGLGDTTTKRDLKIDQVKHNKIAYLKDRFAVEIDVKANNLKGKTTKLVVYHNQRTTGRQKKFEQDIELVDESFLAGFQVPITADAPGIQHYIVEVSSVQGEFTRSNNRYDFYVDVLDGRKKILLLADAPHPDISAIKRSIFTNNNYELEIEYVEDFKKGFKDYNLVILHSIPSADKPTKDILKNVQAAKVPVFYILGGNTNIGQFNKSQDILSIKQGSASLNDVTPAFNENFQLFKLPEEISKDFEEFPPVFAPFGEYKLLGNSKILMHQKIGTVASDYPLLAFNDAVGSKVGIFAGDGLWRWRIYDYLEHDSHETFDEWFNQVIQFLSIKTDKRPFKVFPDKNRFSENEQVKFNAQVYNANFEPINDPDVELTIFDQDNKEYEYVFERQGDAYIIDVGFLPVGAYRYSGKTNYGGKSLVAEGSFTVNPIQLEGLETKADHQLLYMLAENSGGQLFYPNQLDKLGEDIRNQENINTLLFESFQTNSIINLKWIFFVLAGFIFLEWFLRKYHGGY